METSGKIRIVTHDAGFHSDDVFGVAALLVLLGEDNCEVVRSRDPEIVKTGAYVLDVGLVYDEVVNKFDHHQEGGAGERKNGVPYASFGLIWKKFGKEMCESQSVADYIDRKLVQPIDAFDNGKEIYDSAYAGLHPYTIQLMTMAYEPAWNEDRSNDGAFMEMVEIAQTILRREIVQATQYEAARDKVRQAYDESRNKQIIALDIKPPIGRVLGTEIITEYPNVLYFAIPKGYYGDLWQAVAAVDDITSFKTRKSFPEEWAGKEGEELARITGVQGAQFCHRGRFMVLAKSKEAVLKLAELALEA